MTDVSKRRGKSADGRQAMGYKERAALPFHYLSRLQTTLTRLSIIFLSPLSSVFTPAGPECSFQPYPFTFLHLRHITWPTRGPYCLHSTRSSTTMHYSTLIGSLALTTTAYALAVKGGPNDFVCHCPE